MEHIIHTHIIQHCDSQNILQNCQHGFRKKKLSCESQLDYHHRRITTQHRPEETSRCNHIGIFKSFDTVAHNKLITKFQNYGIYGKTNKWIIKWLKFRNQKVVLDGEMSDPVPVTFGVYQGTVFGPLMFLLYTNDISQNINSKIRLFADECVLYREINSKLDCLELQQDLQKLVDRSHTWKMSFNINKCDTYLTCPQKKNSPSYTLTQWTAHR